MKLAIAALTKTGKQLAKKLQSSWKEPVTVYVSKKLADECCQQLPKETITENFSYFFQHYDGVVCIMAAGIAVRGMAPFVKDKRTDPAVIVMDEKGQFVISLLSGHLGGANQLARKIAAVLNAQPVITTATDVQNVAAVDLLVQELKAWLVDFRQNTKKINMMLAEGQPVGLWQKTHRVADTRGLTLLKQLEEAAFFPVVLYVSDQLEVELPKNAVQIVPRSYSLGIGCKKGTPFQTIKTEYIRFCDKHRLHPYCVKEIVSIDLKQKEPGILALADWLEVPFSVYPAEELAAVASKFSQSAFVKSVTGVGSVALAAADLASSGHTVTSRYANRGVTFAFGKADTE